MMLPMSDASTLPILVIDGTKFDEYEGFSACSRGCSMTTRGTATLTPSTTSFAAASGHQKMAGSSGGWDLIVRGDSDALGMVPTGGELTLFEAVGRFFFFFFFFPPPPKDVRRDLKGAWSRPEQAVSAGRPLRPRGEGTQLMIVLGADMHKSSHTLAAVAAATGEMLDEKTAAVGARGFDAVLRWARGVGPDRVLALEDCRHVSGSFERFLIARAERVVRVPTRLMANSRRSSRERGKSDRIDAIASRAPRWPKASRRCRPLSWRGRSSIFGCWSTIASGWSASALGSTTRCSGTCTICGPSWCCRAARCSTASGGRGSRGAWPR